MNTSKEDILLEKQASLEKKYGEIIPINVIKPLETGEFLLEFYGIEKIIKIYRAGKCSPFIAYLLAKNSPRDAAKMCAVLDEDLTLRARLRTTAIMSFNLEAIETVADSKASELLRIEDRDVAIKRVISLIGSGNRHSFNHNFDHRTPEYWFKNYASKTALWDEFLKASFNGASLQGHWLDISSMVEGVDSQDMINVIAGMATDYRYPIDIIQKCAKVYEVYYDHIRVMWKAIENSHPAPNRMIDYLASCVISVGIAQAKDVIVHLWNTSRTGTAEELAHKHGLNDLIEELRSIHRIMQALEIYGIYLVDPWHIF